MKNNYHLFLEFIQEFSPTGFQNINVSHPLVKKLEKITEENNQFFLVADLISLNFNFISNRSYEMTGVKKENFDPNRLFQTTHPDDLEMRSRGRLKLLKVSQDIYIKGGGTKVLSANYRISNHLSEYSNLLFQCYLFYNETPKKTVYMLQIITNVDSFKSLKKHYHFYEGDDLDFFRFPDEDLISIGPNLSQRELQIIKLIEKGMTSEQIGTQLFLSKHTVDTHRSNILKKTNKAHISDCIYELKEKGQI